MKKETQVLFNALSNLEDVRELLRKTAPSHNLSKKQKEYLKKKSEKIKKYCDKLVELL